MSDREAVPADFVGKTIEACDVSAINIWHFRFTDGSLLSIVVESFGNVGPGMVVCDECAEQWDLGSME